jgi:hypothetical protein
MLYLMTHAVWQHVYAQDFSRKRSNEKHTFAVEIVFQALWLAMALRNVQ